MAERQVLVEQHGAVRRLVLNRPAQRNALDHATVSKLLDLFAEIDADREAHVVVLAGAGAGFSAGADLKEAKDLRDASSIAAHADLMARLLIRPFLSSKPVVAEIHGFALGAGLGLALACDAVICAEDARLAFPELRHGMVPALVAPSLLRRLGHAAAFEILARGRDIPVARAERLGLVRTAPRADVTNVAMHFAAEVADAPPDLVMALKALLREVGSLAPEAAMAVARETNVAGKLRRLQTEAIS